MALSQALRFLQPAAAPETRLGLDRIRALLHHLGNPQRGLRFVHVAGTNGKGSVCAMLASILQAAGYRTGRYTSPHLVRLNERIVVDEQEIADGDLIAATELVRQAVDRMWDPPTEFERITAVGLLYFKQRRCDVVVLEVGLGGRLDATNVIDAPDAAVITHIALEHTQYLGDTLGKIAAEKAGIVKGGTPVVLSAQSGQVETVVRQRCQERGAALHVTEPGLARAQDVGWLGQRLWYRGRENLQVPLLGAHQIQNALAVLDTVDVLAAMRGYHIPPQAVVQGLAQARWPGRLEVLRQRPLVLVDGAHNPDGAAQLAAFLDWRLPRGRLTVVMGVMADKDHLRMVRSVAPWAARFLAVTPDCPRALDAQTLCADIRAATGLPAVVGGTVEEGLRLALGAGMAQDGVLIFGSLYQVGAARACLLHGQQGQAPHTQECPNHSEEDQ